jgi:hypothetical protein
MTEIISRTELQRMRQKPAQFALGRLPAGKMNGTEAKYAQHLSDLRMAGEILWYGFEAVKLRLADNTFYTPDFAVMAKDGVIEMHEVKGFMRDDAAVKIKVAASAFPFRFKLVRLNRGEFSISEIGNE